MVLLREVPRGSLVQAPSTVEAREPSTLLVMPRTLPTRVLVADAPATSASSSGSRCRTRGCSDAGAAMTITPGTTSGGGVSSPTQSGSATSSGLRPATSPLGRVKAAWSSSSTMTKVALGALGVAALLGMVAFVRPKRRAAANPPRRARAREGYRLVAPFHLPWPTRQARALARRYASEDAAREAAWKLTLYANAKWGRGPDLRVVKA